MRFFRLQLGCWQEIWREQTELIYNYTLALLDLQTRIRLQENNVKEETTGREGSSAEHSRETPLHASQSMKNIRPYCALYVVSFRFCQEQNSQILRYRNKLRVAPVDPGMDENGNLCIFSTLADNKAAGLKYLGLKLAVIPELCCTSLGSCQSRL